MEKRCPKCGHDYDPEVVPGLEGACPRCMAGYIRSEGRGLSSFDSEAAAGGGYESPPLNEGAKLGKFEVLEYLGRGGMGFVYKAKQAGLDRTVALKVLAPRLAVSPEFAARFDREAKTLAALSHPNIVQVHDYGEENGLYFLVMEYVDGTSLRRVLSTQKLTPETALRYVPQICDALEYAHSSGVIHRDIKPENILIDRHGNLKIADFGLAKMAAGPIASDAATEPAGHATASGQVMGTPHYMAPEQVEGLAGVDHRADIYSLGVVFYEMLTGELPLGRFPNPSQRVAVDVRFDEVVLKALEKEPEKRYQWASQVKEDVTLLGESPPAAALQPGAGNLTAAVGVKGVLLVAFKVVAGAFSCLLIAGAAGVAGQDGLAAALLAVAGATGIITPFLLHSRLNALLARALVILAGLMICGLGSVYLGVMYKPDPQAAFWEVQTYSIHWHGAAGIVSGVLLMWGAALLLRRGSPRPVAAAAPVAAPREDARLSRLALAGALCLPGAIIVGILAGVLAHVASGHDHLREPTAWVAVLSGTAILLLGLTLGIAALVAIRGSGGRLSGRGFAWVGILQLPVVWFLLFVWLMQGSTASPELTAEPTGVEQMNPDAARVKTRDDIFWGQPMFGLQAGLAVKQAKFEAGKPMEFLVHFRNDGENRITTIPPCPETLVFIRGKDADHPISPRSRERNSRLPFDLKAGQEKAFPVSVGGPGWLFDGKPADQLAAGTYSVHLNHLWPGPGKNWLLCVSGPVEIEIVEPEGRGP